MAGENKYCSLPFVVMNEYFKHLFKLLTLVGALVAVSLLSACGPPGSSTDKLYLEEPSMATDDITIYSPAPMGTMLHEHNVALGDILGACDLARNIRVIAMALPDSINVINQLDIAEKPYHLPIVTTLDFKTAIEGNAPEWHGYHGKSSDLRFVTSLYDVAYGLLVVDPSIRSPADLAGKRIAVPARPSAVRWFTEVLLRDGWDSLDQVTLVDIAPPNVPAAIASGEIDVVAWNIMSETPDGFRPLLPMVLNNNDAHWLDVDLETVAAINAANSFKTERTTVPLGNIIGVDGLAGVSANLLSFRQALAAWTSTPDDVISEIVQCLSRADLPFGADAAFVDKQFNWPELKDSEIHSAAGAARAIDVAK